MPVKPLQISLLVTALLAAGGGYLASETHKNIIEGFKQRGWNTALKINSKTDDTTFMIKCLINKSCQSAYTNVMHRRHVYWYAAAALFGAVGLFGTLTAIRKGAKIDPNYKKPGNSKWADREEIPLYISGDPDDPKGNPQRGYLGILRDGTILAAPERLRNAHNIVIGGPGAAKSTGYHKPNQILDALQGTCSVVIDLKFPDYRAGFLDIVPLFYEAGRNIQVYAPFTMSTMRLNLLQNATNLEGAYDVASMLIPDAQEGGAAYYKNIERTLLSAILLGIANTETPSMNRAFQICLRGAGSIKDFISKHPDKMVVETAAAMLELDNKTISGIAAGLTNALQIFSHPAVNRATTPKDGENMDLDRFWFEPGLFYIGLEQDQMLGPRGKTLIQILKRLIDNSMMRVAKMRHNPYTGEVKPAGQMPIHVAFYLDEFPAMGVLPDISNSFAMMRSYRVSYHVTLQNLSQAEVLYTRDGFRSFFNNNLQHIFFFPSRTKMDDAKYFSDYLGETTVTERRYSDSQQKQWIGGNGSTGESWGDAMRKMLSPGEMLTYPANEAILFVIGAPAVQVVMPGYYQEHYYLYKKDPVTDRTVEDRSKKFKNPIYPLYKALAVHDPNEFLETIMQGMHNDRPDEHELELTEVESFQAWAMAISRNGARVKVFGKKYNISRKELPFTLTDEAQLLSWEQKSWINVRDDQITIKQEGIRIMGQPIARELASLKYRGGLMIWIHQHASLLENHPEKKLAGTPDDQIAGYYEPECVLITPEDARSIWSGVLPPDAYKVRRDTRHYYRIPVNNDDFLIQMDNLARAASGEAPAQDEDNGDDAGDEGTQTGTQQGGGQKQGQQSGGQKQGQQGGGQKQGQQGGGQKQGQQGGGQKQNGPNIGAPKPPEKASKLQEWAGKR